jgi:hypothetical protein
MSILINAYCTQRTLPPLDFPHELKGLRDRTDPELAEHLDGFVGYVLSRGEKKMTRVKYHVMRHLQRVRHHATLTLPEDQLDTFTAWAWAANAIGFLPDGSVCDPSGRVLLDTEGGEPDAEARIPYPPDAETRKARSMARLGELGVHVPASLPPVIGEGEVALRLAGEAAQRALSLQIVSLRGECWNTGAAFPHAALEQHIPVGFADLSPKEAVFLAAEAPEPQAIVNFSWRYEALFLLQWALGWAPNLPDPTDPCDVHAVLRVIRESDEAALLGGASLRPAAAILDTLDLHYRLHWAVRQARLDKKPPPADLNSSVVSERHHALNWLVRFEDAAWDEVDTPT